MMRDQAFGRQPCNQIHDPEALEALLGDRGVVAPGLISQARPFLSLDELRRLIDLPRDDLEGLVGPPRFAMSDKVSGQERVFRIVPGCYLTDSEISGSELEDLGFVEQPNGSTEGGLRVILPGEESLDYESQTSIRRRMGDGYTPVVTDDQGNTRLFAPHGIDVWFANHVTQSVAARFLQRHDITIAWSAKAGDADPLYVLGKCRPRRGIDSLTTVLLIIEEIQRHSDVLFAEPQELGLLDFGPDPTVNQVTSFESADRDWNLRALNLDVAHGISKGAHSVTVFVVDSGAATGHPDLSGALRQDWLNHDLNYSIYADSDATSPEATGILHGTKVASIAVGRGDQGQGVAGIAPACPFLPVKIAGSPTGAGYGARAAAIRQCLALVQPGERGVINLSWGMSGDHIGIREALIETSRRNVPVAASGGNYSVGQHRQANRVHYPSAYSHLGPKLDNLCAVGATDYGGQVADYSYFGDESITFGAPGGEIGGAGAGVYVAIDGSMRAFAYGTSFASPHAVGALALLLSVDPDLAADDAIDLLRKTCRPIPGPIPLGAGVLDIGSAVQAAKAGISVEPGDGGAGEPAGRIVLINSASAAEIAERLGVSSWRATQVVSYREEHGPFMSPWDLVFTGVWDFWLLAPLVDNISVEI